jgi:purine-binding chemotaxis protein CheW
LWSIRNFKQKWAGRSLRILLLIVIKKRSKNMSVEGITKVSQYLTFKLENEEYALDVADVREVLEQRLNRITKIPRTPDYLRGVINVRGSVVPVIDMRLKFNMNETEETIDTCIIVIEVDLEGSRDGKTTILGVLADSVQEVVDLEPEQIEKAPEIGNQLKTEFITGIGKKDDKFIIILKINKILTSEELNQVNITSGRVSTENEAEIESGKACEKMPVS